MPLQPSVIHGKAGTFSAQTVSFKVDLVDLQQQPFSDSLSRPCFTIPKQS